MTMEYGLWCLAGLRADEDGAWLPEEDFGTGRCAANDNAGVVRLRPLLFFSQSGDAPASD